MGIACLREYNERLDINNILISCRALGCGLEDAIMKSVQFAIKKNKRSIRGHYLSSDKNSLKTFILKDSSPYCVKWFTRFLGI